jgi:hypothetical protein
MQPARAQRIASQTIRAPCSAAQRIASHPVHHLAPRECNRPRAAHCIATSSQRIASQTIRAPCSAAQRIASHPVHHLAPRECNRPRAAHCIATSPRAAHCIANNPRTDNQPATHRPPRPLRIACRTANTSHLQLCTRFAVLCAGFVLFVVLTFPKFNLNTLRIAFSLCVRSSVGTELGNLELCPGFDSGRKFSDFFYFRHFLHS